MRGCSMSLTAVLRSGLCVLVACAIGAAAAAAAAPPPDSLAPKGAAHNWLPKEGWVWMHWLPFDERELASALGTDSAGIRAHLADDRRTLATLARRRGWHVKSLARHLTRRFAGRVPRARLALLRWRAERMLTQGHLAQHVLYHTMHGPAVPAHAPELFGMTRETFLAARQAGLTPNEIAVRAGRDPVAARAGVLALLTFESERGVSTRSQSRAQARRMLARQRGDLDCWMATPLPKLDAHNPFGGAGGGHGRHAPHPGLQRLGRRAPALAGPRHRTAARGTLAAMKDADEFAELYEREAETVLLFVTRRTLDAEVALDITAETFAQAFRGRRGFRGSTAPEERAWLFTIARRQIGRWVRRGSVERRALNALGANVPGRPRGRPSRHRGGGAARRAARGARAGARAPQRRPARGAAPTRRRGAPLRRGRPDARHLRADGAGTGVARLAHARSRGRAAAAGGAAMRARPPILDELGRELVRAARADESRARGGVLARAPRALVIGLLTLFGLAAAAAAASLIVGRGDPIPAARAGDVPLELRPVAGSARLNGLRVPDPDGGPAWDVRTSRSRTGAICATVGQVLGGELGLLASIGASARSRPVRRTRAARRSAPARRSPARGAFAAAGV